MDQGGHDIPNQAPGTPLGLGSVGVTRSAIPVFLKDPLGSDRVIQLSCEVDARVSLAQGRRGIHVSRIGDLLAELSETVHPSLVDYAVRVAELMRERQRSAHARVSVQGVLTYREQISGVKQKSSLEHLELLAEASCDESKDTERSSSLGFSHITACPCVQETYRNSFLNKDHERTRGHIPLITHTQRCRTRIEFAGMERIPNLRDLLAAIDAVVVRNQNTLPREFELLNVHRAHAQPQFLEDVLRNLMLALYRLVRPQNATGELRIASVSMESIHDFDMRGEIAFSLKELDQIFGSGQADSRNGQRSPKRLTNQKLKSRLQKAGRKKPGRPLQTKRSPQAHSSL